MDQPYHPGQRAFQDRFDTRRLADRLAESTTDVIDARFRAFIEQRDMFFLATVDGDGRPEVSYKGGAPGFLCVPDERTVAFPVYDGNGMFLSAGNISVNPSVAMLFIDWATGTRLRLTGVAHVDPDDPLAAGYPGAQFVVRVTPRTVFANCRRYVHRMQPVGRSPFVPTADQDPPVPDWKLDPWFEGTLPAADPALDPEHPSAPSIPRF